MTLKKSLNQAQVLYIFISIRFYISKFFTFNFHFNFHLNLYFQLNRSGNSHFYFYRKCKFNRKLKWKSKVKILDK